MQSHDILLAAGCVCRCVCVCLSVCLCVLSLEDLCPCLWFKPQDRDLVLASPHARARGMRRGELLVGNANVSNLSRLKALRISWGTISDFLPVGHKGKFLDTLAETSKVELTIALALHSWHCSPVALAVQCLADRPQGSAS